MTHIGPNVNIGPRLRIVRLENTEQGSLGVLLFPNEIFCFTLEPDINDDLGRLYIPYGHFMCKRFHGDKWTNTFEIVVANHSAVLFHSGNIEAHTRGCVLLGATVGKLKGNRAVLNSGTTFRAFLKRLENVDVFPLTIEDRY